MTPTPRSPSRSGIDHIGGVILARNAGEVLPGLIQGIESSLRRGAAERTIFVVDDGSTDGTAQAAAVAARRMPLSVIRHPFPRGAGHALQSGLLAARHISGAVVTLDAGEGHDPACIAEMISQLESGSHDVVIASRFLPKSVVPRLPGMLRPLELACARLASLGSPVRHIRDLSSSCRAYRSTVIARLLLRGSGGALLGKTGAAAHVELLCRLGEMGIRIGEIPCVIHRQPEFHPRRAGICAAALAQWTALSKLRTPRLKIRRKPPAPRRPLIAPPCAEALPAAASTVL
jgi:dolichol-phosphate mannosyltransferase